MTPEGGVVYRREVFTYSGRGRPDPFRPLLGAEDLGVRVEDLRLTSVIYNPNPAQSIAVFIGADSSRMRLRVGQRTGNITVTAIYPRRVDLRVDEFGVSRGHSILLKRQPIEPQPATPPPGPQQEPRQDANTPAVERGPLRRGPPRPAPTAPGSAPAPTQALQKGRGL